MLAAMDKKTKPPPPAADDKQPPAASPVEDFLTSGRTGRRNALYDILGEHAATSVADLPACLEKLNTDADASTSGASGSGAPNPFSRTDAAPTSSAPPPLKPGAAAKPGSPNKPTS